MEKKISENDSTNAETKLQQGYKKGQLLMGCSGGASLRQWQLSWFMNDEKNQGKIRKTPAIPEEWTVMQISKSELELDVLVGLVGLEYAEQGEW